MNSFGNKFRITVFGESHGPYTGVVMDGVTPGMTIGKEDFVQDLQRRKTGDLADISEGVTARQEEDVPEFVSGVFKSKTTGAPLAILFANKSHRPQDYQGLEKHPRPSHADFAASVKFNSFNDLRGGGQFSGRMTLALVAAGVVAKKMLAEKGLHIRVKAKVLSIAGSKDSSTWKETVLGAKAEGDSVGGEVICTADGVPAGAGSPFFDSLESQISRLAFSIPGVKAISFGDYSDCPPARISSDLKGSRFNDLILDKNGRTQTNHSGGINGGISNGNPLVFTLDIRPAASISKPQLTFNFESGQTENLSIRGRHDACIALRCPVIAEAVAVIVLANNL